MLADSSSSILPSPLDLSSSSIVPAQLNQQRDYNMNPDLLAATRISLDFTHVFYNTDDPISLAMACLSLVPQALLVSYATLMLSRREMETFMMFAGQLGSEIFNEYVKSQIRQERPSACK